MDKHCLSPEPGRRAEMEIITSREHHYSRLGIAESDSEDFIIELVHGRISKVGRLQVLMITNHTSTVSVPLSLVRFLNGQLRLYLVRLV